MVHRKSTLLAWVLAVAPLVSFTAGAEMIKPQRTPEANVALGAAPKVEVAPLATIEVAAPTGDAFSAKTRESSGVDHDRHDGDYDGDDYWHHRDPKPTPLPGALLLLFCGLGFLLVIGRRRATTDPLR